MKDPEASWKGICSTSMKGPEPRPRKGWGQEKTGKRRLRTVSEERLGRRPEAHAQGPEKAQNRPKAQKRLGRWKPRKAQKKPRAQNRPEAEKRLRSPEKG